MRRERLLAIVYLIVIAVGALVVFFAKLPARYIGSIAFGAASILIFFFLPGDPLHPRRFFTTIWFVGLSAACLRLTPIEEVLSARAWAGIILGTAGFLGGTYLIRPREDEKEPPYEWRLAAGWNERRVGILNFLLFVVTTFAIWYEIYRLGEMPLFAQNPQWAKFAVNINSYFHRIALSAMVVGMVTAGLLFSRRDLRWRKWMHILPAALAFLSLCMFAQRLIVITTAVVALVAYHYLRKKLTPAKVALGIVLILGILGFLMAGIRRDVVAVDRYLPELAKKLEEKAPAPSAPSKPEAAPQKAPATRAVAPPVARREGVSISKVLAGKGGIKKLLLREYIDLAMPFSNFQTITRLVPDEVPYGYGYYTFYLLRLFSTPRNPDKTQVLHFLKNRGYEFNVPTFLAVFYLDWGICGVILGSIGVGALCMGIYRMMRRTPTPFTVLFYGMVVLNLLFVFYDNLFYQVSFWWNAFVVKVIDWLGRER